MSTFDTKGPIAEAQLDLFMITVWVSLFIFVVVGAVFLVATIKFRERKNDDRPMPAQGHGNPLVEIGLIGASVLLLVIVAVPTLRAIWYTHDFPVIFCSRPNDASKRLLYSAKSVILDSGWDFPPRERRLVRAG